jgi:RNA polymerase sigma-70 factor, ECF subfamily
MQQLSDEELVARHRAEGGPWINELFGRYHRRVAIWCYRFTGDRDSAADLAQEVFLRAYRSLEAFRGDSKFSTWLYTIARNHCLNEMKARASRPEQNSELLELEIADGATNVLRELEREESMQSMRDLIAETLDETETQVMVLHFGEEIKLDAITRLLGLTNASGARAYVVSAKRKLAAAVTRWNAREQRGRR